MILIGWGYLLWTKRLPEGSSSYIILTLFLLGAGLTVLGHLKTGEEVLKLSFLGLLIHLVYILILYKYKKNEET